MELIELIDTFGLITVICGVISSMLCGIIKLPIVNMIRKYDRTNAIDTKKTSDKIRNACNLIVGLLSVIFVSAWYLLTRSFSVFLDVRIYAEMLGAFTCAKFVYMIYEGIGKCSIKKLLHMLVNALKLKFNKNHTAAPKTAALSVIQQFFVDAVHLPLTDDQLSQLNQLLLANEKTIMLNKLNGGNHASNY